MTSQQFKPHASITLSNHGGIEIMFNRSCDGVYYRFNYGQDNLDKERIKEAEILYDKDGETYFKAGRTIYYLNQAMRIDY